MHIALCRGVIASRALLVLPAHWVRDFEVSVGVLVVQVSVESALYFWLLSSGCFDRLDAQEFCRAMGARGIVRVASGGNPVKFYFHAQPVGSAGRLLLEVLGGASGLKVVVKAEDSSLTEPLQELFTRAVAGFS